MFLNYLKLSFRLLARNPFFAFINVAGLAIGFASFYVLWEFSTSELKSDQYHQDFDRIARIGVNWRWSHDHEKTWGHIVAGGQLTYLQDIVNLDHPEIEASVRVMNPPFLTTGSTGHGNEILISVPNSQHQQRLFKEMKAAYADANLFSFFSIPLIHGQPDKVLREARFVVLSQATATKYFGEGDPTGELLKLNDTITLRVSGVYQDLPHNTHLNFDLVISNKSLLNQWSRPEWSWTHFYVKLKEGITFSSLESGLNKKVREYYAPVLREFPFTKTDFFVQPLEEVAFSQSFYGDNFYPKSKTFLFTLAFIALSVLSMAVVNYVNLTVTRATSRMKEVATRKVSGAGVLDMVKQFMTEAAVVNGLALILALTLIQLMKGPMSFLFNIQIAELSSLNGLTILIFLAILSAAILLSGLYPAIISIAHHPGTLFRISHSTSGKRIVPSLLTISQFSAALVFILFGFVVSLQLNHILNKETGIKKDEILIVDGPIVKSRNSSLDFELLKKQIAGQSGVSSVAASNVVIGDSWAKSLLVKRMGAELFFGMDNAGVDENFIPLYEVSLISGRNFLPDDRADVVVLSRFATTRLGFQKPDDAVGVTLNLRQDPKKDWLTAEVIGVFDDFRVVSLLNMSKSSSEYSQQGRGIVLLNKDRLFQNLEPQRIGLKISSTKIQETISEVSSLYSKQFPGNSFTWYFLDDHANRAYGNEMTARNQIFLFTGLAIGIACMGLLGMITYKALEKTKEIGIRKALGAKTIHIGNLLLNSTLKQMMISVALGIPLAYYLIQQYFEKFADHVRLQWWHYALPVMILTLIMLTTVASVLWKAARSNPVEALKYE